MQIMRILNNYRFLSNYKRIGTKVLQQQQNIKSYYNFLNDECCAFIH